MHVKKLIRWPKLTALALFISLIMGINFVPNVLAQSASPTANCNVSKTSCSITFPYSGDYYSWSFPADTRSATFSISGAQGGRSGGNGSKTGGTFRTIPTGALFIYVGGQGSSGNNAAGGFNGGGAAGQGHNDEGSGGGATDIRTSTLLTDRIAVAGGGGGTGGWVGGAGAGAGGTNGLAGASGQGAGGSGGTPTAGGSGGSSNGAATTPGSAGSLGQGGAGGSANTPGTQVAGGGGGGGGYYGGGGGGADTDPAGTDGGGGGAGSSYVNATKFQSVSYAVANQVGDGQATITYLLGPTVTSFTAPSSPSNAVSPVFNITFGQSITGLTADDFTISGTATNCYVSLLTGSGASYAATVAGCSDGTIALTLKADSVTGNAIGPVRAVNTTPITLDRTLPELNTLTKQPSSNDTIIYRAVFTESVSGLAGDSTDWLVKGDGCSISSLTGSALEYTITLTGCLDGHLAGLVLNSLSVIDTAGNIGPSLNNQTGVTKIDTSPPVIHVTDVTAPGLGSVPTFVFDSEEPVTGMNSSKFVASGTATGCTMNYSVLRSGLGWQISFTGCSLGTVKVTLAANSVSDSSNNLGPITAVASSVVTLLADEVVNQTVVGPTGNQGAAIKVIKEPKDKSQSGSARNKDDIVSQKPEVIEKPDTVKVIEPKEKVTKSATNILTEQPLVLVLVGLALLLSVISLTSNRKVRTKRH